MTKLWRCDKCEKSFGYSDYNANTYVRNKSNSNDFGDNVDLCNGCIKLFKEWLKVK